MSQFSGMKIPGNSRNYSIKMQNLEGRKMAGLEPTDRTTEVSSLLPGLCISSLLAVVAAMLAPLFAPIIPIPALVIALIIGISLHPWIYRAFFTPGLRFCVSRLLRISVALLGLRVELGDLASLGLHATIIVILSMTLTILSGLLLAQALGLSRAFGAIAGVATGVCGASAAMAASSVLPSYPGKQADTAFVIIAVNILSTVAMLTYPSLGQLMGFGDKQMGILLGGTIHDVAQVVGAGYSVSDQVGALSVVVKLFRVLLLLPVILIVGHFFLQSSRNMKVQFPLFALAFLFFCIVNSIMPLFSNLVSAYGTVKSIAETVSSWGLLFAIAALGLSTSIRSITQLGIKHIMTVIGTTLVILAVIVVALTLEAAVRQT